MYLSPAGERLTLPPVPLDAAAIPPLPSIPFGSPQLRVATRTTAFTATTRSSWRESAGATRPRRSPRYDCGGRTSRPGVRRAVRRRGLGSAHAASSDHLLAARDARERARRARHLPPRRMDLHPPPPLTRPGPNSGWSKPSAAAPLCDGIAGLWVWWYVPPSDPGRS